MAYDFANLRDGSPIELNNYKKNIPLTKIENIRIKKGHVIRVFYVMYWHIVCLVLNSTCQGINIFLLFNNRVNAKKYFQIIFFFLLINK